MGYGRGRRRNPRNITLILDWIHIIIGILVMIMAVIAFINPENNMILFPIIFFLAAVLNIVNGVYRYSQSDRDQKKKASAIGLLIIAAFLLTVMIISAVSIWR